MCTRVHVHVYARACIRPTCARARGSSPHTLSRLRRMASIGVRAGDVRACGHWHVKLWASDIWG